MCELVDSGLSFWNLLSAVRGFSVQPLRDVLSRDGVHSVQNHTNSRHMSKENITAAYKCPG